MKRMLKIGFAHGSVPAVAGYGYDSERGRRTCLGPFLEVVRYSVMDSRGNGFWGVAKFA